MPTLYLYDPDGDRWRALDNPFSDEFTEALLASARHPECSCTDADIEYGYRATAADVSIVHQRDCA